MTAAISYKLLLLVTTIKGAVIAAVVLMVLHSNELSDFTKALIIAAVSATITGLFGLLTALYTIRATQQTHQDVTDIKQSLQLTKRTEDQGSSE